ncbi:TetR/AcrR family transcriptional regulator [Gordonia sp. (in: high G+C Gram-positive bacteria)]|uniref:TetR/AcrR family transcriptional regulator n=1 Tax=Gordonia sp. (in: high G+C Gram-positive bacteria) TaxID=84139 RepID=UPI0039E5F9B4
MPRTDRRPLIADAALALAASGGNHALTHQGIDRALELPKGSTSYYFRTREALVAAAVGRVVERSREALARTIDVGGTPGEVMVGYVAELVADRRSDVLARQALLLDPTLSVAARASLLGCLFSEPSARALLADRGSTAPVADARRLLTILEGVVVTAVHGETDVRDDATALLSAVFPELFES